MSRSCRPSPKPRRMRHLPSTITAMNASTYMSPYQRIERGPRCNAMGSNCGWTSKAAPSVEAVDPRRIIPEDRGHDGGGKPRVQLRPERGVVAAGLVARPWPVASPEKAFRTHDLQPPARE